MFISLRKQIKVLEYDIHVLETQLEDALASKEAWQRAAEAAKADLRIWREKFELSQTNPEVKADTEAAFKRGAYFGKQQLLQNIYVMGQSLDIEIPKEEADA